MTSPISVRRISNFTANDLEAVSSIFTEAFAKVQRHSTVTTNRPWLLSRAEAHAALIGGEVYIAEIDGTPVGAAACFAPGTALFGSDEQKTKAAAPLVAALDPDIQKWFSEYAAAADKAFGLGFKASSYHLQTIGVLPEYRGKGISRVLIEHVQREVIPRGIPLSLEAATIYEKIGFKNLGGASFKNKDGVEAGELDLYFMSLMP